MTLQQANEKFEDLYKRKRKAVLGVCKRYGTLEEAEEMSQDIFLNVFKNLDRFEGRSTLDTWLYSITRNYCCNYIRKKKTKKRDAVEISLNMVLDSLTSSSRRTLHEEILQDNNSPDPQDYAENMEKRELILNGIKKLSQPQQHCMYLLVNNAGIKYQDIANILKIPINTVRSRVSRARDNLKKFLVMRGVEI